MAFYMEEMSVLDMRNAMKKTHTVIIPVGVVEQMVYIKAYPQLVVHGDQFFQLLAELPKQLRIISSTAMTTPALWAISAN